MFARTRLKTVVTGSLLAVGIIPAVAIGILALHNGGEALEAQALAKLEGMRDLKKDEVEAYFRNALQDTEALARSQDAVILYSKLVEYHDSSGVKNNGPYDVSTDEYEQIWKEHGENLNRYCEDGHAHDVSILCAAHGHVMYTYAKESDLGTNLGHGSYKGSGLGRLWRKVVSSKGLAVVDFAPYAPSNDDPAAFVGAPIYDDGEMVGVMAVQLSIDRINAVMNSRSGMGVTGETILVGADYLMRSDSFRDPEDHSVLASFRNPQQGRVDTVATRAVHERNESGTGFVDDYLGHPVVVAYAPVRVGDITWALMAKVDESEAFAAISTLRWLMGVTIAAVAVAVVVLAMTITRMVNRKLAIETSQLQSSSAQLRSASEQQLSGTAEQTAATGQVLATMKELAATAAQIAERCQQVARLVDSAAARCQEGDESVRQGQSVTTEIKRQIEKIVQHMVDLGNKSQQISLAVDVISELSEQTTILSYNAAIEAAAAGEAGQTFSVVADQVGKLADRAKQAAKEVRCIVEEIQKSTSTTIMATEDGLKAADRGMATQNDASQKMVRVAEEIRSTLSAAKEIEMSSKQQTTAAEQVREGLNQVVNAAKESEASAKQTLGTAALLVTTAANLDNI